MVQVIFRPTGNGALNELPTQNPATGYHWDKVDEETADDGVTFLQGMYYSGPLTKSELFTFSPSVLGGQINYVRVYRRAKMSTAASSMSIIRIGGTSYVGVYVAGNRSYKTEYDEWTVDPSTSSQWSWSTIYDLQFGARFYGVDSLVVNSYTQAWMVVDYTEDTGGSNVMVGDFGFY
jgi:hypothetical protein